jgi:hypothetical protein
MASSIWGPELYSLFGQARCRRSSDEYMRTGKAREGTKTNMGVMVARIIPEDL